MLRGLIFSDRKGLGKWVYRCLRCRASPCEGNPQTLISAGWYLALCKSHKVICHMKATCKRRFPASLTFKGCVVFFYWDVYRLMNYYIKKEIVENMSKYWKNHFEHRFYITFRRRRRPHQRRSLPPQQAARNKPRYPLSFPRNRQSSSAPLSDLEFLLARTCCSFLPYLFIATSRIYCVNYSDIKCCIVRQKSPFV